MRLPQLEYFLYESAFYTFILEVRIAHAYVIMFEKYVEKCNEVRR